VKRIRKLQDDGTTETVEDGSEDSEEFVAPALIDPNSRYISNPIICKTLGSAVMWENISLEKYPIYVKDSLLNTNSDFDFGEFTELPDTIANTGAEAFVFTFT